LNSALARDGSQHLRPRLSGPLRRALASLGAFVRLRTGFSLRLAALAFGVAREALVPASWRRTSRAELRRTLRQAVGGLPTTLVAATLAGLGVVSQAVYWLGEAGQEALMGSILVTMLVRELTPLLVGLIVLGRSGMVTVAELGAMQLGGQVRAIAGQGLDPFSFLILPRAVAFALACFTLGVVFVVVALVVGYIAVRQLGGAHRSLWGFLDHVLAAMHAPDVALFPIKMLTIGLLVALVACLTGLSAQPGEQVTTLLPRGFVRGVLAVMLTSLVLSLAA
jgi:phospholipid/cholesterol/gamma-HCH transport system permease protein